MHEGASVAGRYRLVELIGAGGMGEVWRATDEVLGRTVAVKVVLPSLHADPDFGRRFLAEARAMASVHHSGVVAIHDFGETQDPDAGRHGAGRAAFMVMEYVAGESLSALLGRVGRLSPAMTMDLVSQTAQALQAVHNRGIVHRDIKPANLMVRPDGAVAVADFGIAAATNATALTQPGTILGTPSYLAPEQVMGEPASARSDVYALGLVAYECLAGQKPFVAEDPFATALQRVQRPAPPLPDDVPPHVARVVSRALATDPAQRWETAAEFALAAGRAAAGAVSAEPDTAAAPRVMPSRRRRRRWRPAVAAAAVVLLAAGAVSLWAAIRDRESAGATGTGPSSGPGTHDGTGTPTGTGPSGGADQGGEPMPPGFIACGELWCPAVPMCWSQQAVIINDVRSPSRLDCAKAHDWETFAVLRLPADVTDFDPESLMKRSDIAAICSAAMMAGRSRNPGQTAKLDREAWYLSNYPTLVHCVAGSSKDSTRGSAFHFG